MIYDKAFFVCSYTVWVHYFNVYETSLSFGDTSYSKEVYGSVFPYSMDTTGVNAGVIAPDAANALFTDTVWRSFMGLQRHIKKVGTINLGTHEGERGFIDIKIVRLCTFILNFDRCSVISDR